MLLQVSGTQLKLLSLTWVGAPVLQSRQGSGAGGRQWASLAAPPSDPGLWVGVGSAAGLMGGCVSAGLAGRGWCPGGSAGRAQWAVCRLEPPGSSPCGRRPGWGSPRVAAPGD